jgi:hypothetical protein
MTTASLVVVALALMVGACTGDELEALEPLQEVPREVAEG